MTQSLVGYQITSSKLFGAELIEMHANKRVEELWLYTLDTKHRVLNEYLISKGTLNSTPINIKEITYHAIMDNAQSVIITHNHPSGDPTQSSADRQGYQKVGEAIQMFNMSVLDSFVTGSDSYTSSQEESRF
ncbi:hypothetical protein EQG49_00290 [Periweissella cryptocerci]|uniref:MPN domain-containing protein n=1 Tax=Periweissella cryptocerci TaxID=2506420 RepID=A0A4P6YQX8_9LACO|nr:JAB domain-containing protein [Periweissella cryptocerci]QBO34993.1 hypothetical protein EQG49_00290 [Periweissella cryptocerci]